MKLNEINRRITLSTLAKMGPVFRTRELSEHPDMISGHPGSSDRNYHAMIGSYLSAHVAQVELLERLGGRMGARWRNLGVAGSQGAGASRPSSATPDLRASGGLVAAGMTSPSVRQHDAARMGIGPQSSSDDAFAQRMRLHQSWYRSSVLKVPYGTGPRPNDTNHYGNMLTAMDANTGRNFLSPEIYRVAEQRLAQGVGALEPFRLRHNMLSSQPMCFNLLGPLVNDLELASRLVRARWGQHIKRVTCVRIEWAPSPQEQFLNDRTAFDAFIEYELVGGGLGFIGIETKLTEAFSPAHYDGPKYRRWMTPNSPWRESAAQDVDQVEHNQLWRDHLLAWAMLQHPSSSYREGRLALIYHPGDERCVRVVQGYQSLLREQSTFEATTLADLVSKWKPVVQDGSWLDELTVRYLDLHRSESHAVPGRLSTVSRVTGESAGPSRGSTVVASGTTTAIRSGHRRSLKQMENTDAYQRTREMYREALGGVDVYLRPTNAGFTVMSLDPDRCASMIGVGGKGTTDHSIRKLPPVLHAVRRAVEGYETKRATLRRVSSEETYALRLVASALSSRLQLPINDLFFVNQEWRLPSGGKIDLLCVNPLTGRLVVVELKESSAAASQGGKNGDAWDQAHRYAAELHTHRVDTYPFFQRLGRALARNHGAPNSMQELTLDSDHVPDVLVSWDGGGFVGRR